MSDSRRPWWLKITKERILFALGVGGFVHEVLAGEVTERPMLLMACLVMMGVPAFLPDAKRWRSDVFRDGSGSSAPTSPSEPGSSSPPERSPDRPSSSARIGLTVALL